jgi:hypothetical protein
MSDNSLEKVLLEWAAEALDLRHGEANDPKGKVSLPAYELGQSAALDMLQRVRVRLDRVEELQSKARQARGRILRARQQAEFDASVKYDEAMNRARETRVQEFVSAAEKNASAALASLQEKRQLHQWKKSESQATETLDVISDCYWGLEKLREDVLQMLRLQQFVTSEEVQT